MRLLDVHMQAEEPLILAIDGRCGSGKSTFAQQLARQYQAEVIHMDDFFLRPEQRTTERMQEIGGNVDRERFLEEVVLPLGRGKDRAAGVLLTYRRFDCSRQELTDLVQIKRSPLIIVEGTYSCHPYFGDPYDLRIFMDIDPKEQISRISARNGQEMLRRFLEEWIPREEAYFDQFGIREACDLLIR